MGKMMAFSLLTIFIIEASLYFFTGSSYAQTPLFIGLIHPESLKSGLFYAAMLGIIIVAAAATITPGFIYQSNQWAIFAVGCALLITYVSAALQFWSFLHNALLRVASVSAWAGFIASIITAPIIILYITAMVEWTRFNQ